MDKQYMWCPTCVDRVAAGSYHCSFCGVHTRDYPAHVEKRHPGGRLYQPHNNKPRGTMADLLADGEVQEVIDQTAELTVFDQLKLTLANIST